MKNINTPYDDVYRTILTDASDLILPVINEVFGTKFTGDERIELLQNENPYEADDGSVEKRITDSYMKVYDHGKPRYFHIECQSTEDGNMILRIFEYDSLIARRYATINNADMDVYYPESALMALRSTDRTPNKMKITIHTPGNGELSYNVPILKVKQYSIDEIFEKRLYFLIPFHIFKFEKELPDCNSNDEKLVEIKAYYAKLMKRLYLVSKAGELPEFYVIMIRNLSMYVVESLAAKYNKVKKGLGDVMGGKVLNYEAKDILNKGIKQGLEQGLERGKSDGKHEERIALIRQMLSKNMSKDIIHDLGFTETEILEAETMQ